MSQKSQHLGRMLVGLLAASMGSLLLACHGEDGLDPGVLCGPDVEATELVLVLACEGATLEGPIPLFLVNGSPETVWFYHHCSERVPWLSRQEADGSWTSLLPPDAFVPLECEHVEVLLPGENEALLASTQLATGPGTYRVEHAVAWGCVDVHDAAHVPSACARVEIMRSEAFTLN